MQNAFLFSRDPFAMKIGSAISCLSIYLVVLMLPHCAHAQTNGIERDSERKTKLEMPYQSLVKSDGARIYSGPATVHYATDELKQGAVIDVYRHDPGGWCAVRPPAGSFSLVPAAALTIVSDGVGRIDEDGLKAWVGTRLGAVEKPLWQIKLKQNELVDILGEASWPDPEGHSTIWYQIAPPAGEFRWVQLADIQPPKHQSDLPRNTRHPRASNIGSRVSSDSNSIRRTGFQAQDPVFAEDFSDGPIDGFSQGSGSNNSIQSNIGQNLVAPSINDDTANRGWRQAKLPIRKRTADRRSAGLPGNDEPFKIPAIDAPSRSEPVANSTQFSSGSGTRSDGQSSDSSFPYKSGSASDSTDTGNLNTGGNSSDFEITPISGPVSPRIQLLETSLTSEMLKSPDEWLSLIHI